MVAKRKTKLRVNALTITTQNGKEINLSLEDAKELYAQLHELFGAAPSITAPIFIPYERLPWQRPYTPMWHTMVVPPEVTTTNIISCEVPCKGGLSVMYKGDVE